MKKFSVSVGIVIGVFLLEFSVHPTTRRKEVSCIRN